LPDFIFSEEPETKSASVLVVEDCRLTQHVITSLLKELTPKVNQAFDGEEGITMCDNAQYDIIFMDMNMPKINGLQATQRIRKVHLLSLFSRLFLRCSFFPSLFRSLFSFLRSLVSCLLSTFCPVCVALLLCHDTFSLFLATLCLHSCAHAHAHLHVHPQSGKNTWVPIIAFTSTGKLEDYRSFGVDDMLQKPFSTESLASIFDKWTEYVAPPPPLPHSLPSPFSTQSTSGKRQAWAEDGGGGH
jgi:CheY-like chemotaxis protein